jgi:hypothetical protein
MEAYGFYILVLVLILNLSASIYVVGDLHSLYNLLSLCLCRVMLMNSYSIPAFVLALFVRVQRSGSR